MTLLSDLKTFFGIKDEPVIENEPVEEKTEDITTRELDKSTVFRPLSWDQYIGQEKAKEILKTYIRGVTDRNKILGHVLIHGQAGTGKTTLAKLIAQEMNLPLKEVMTGTIEEFWKLEMLIRKCAGHPLFLDEIHAFDRKTAEKIYTIMEDFSFNGRPLPHFTLIGATTEVGEILEKMKPFHDRFKIIIELEPYKVEELVQIIKQFKSKIFPLDKLPEEWYTIISKNCRGVPRTAIRLLEATVYFDNVEKVMINLGIIKNGFTDNDLKALSYIEANEKGVGLQSIASFLGTSVKNYLYQIEPYILQYGAIIRTPRGRKITDTGLLLIEELKGVKNGNNN